MNIKAEPNYFPVSPLVLSGKTASQLNLLFKWLDLLASEEAKTANSNIPRSKLSLDTTIHEVRENPENPESSKASFIAANSAAKLEFIRFPANDKDRKTAETIAQFTFKRPFASGSDSITAEIKEDKHLPILEANSGESLETNHKIFTLHDVNMSGREPKTLEEQEHRADLLNKFRMVLNQLFFQNSLTEIISSYKPIEHIK